jgi:cobalt transport protein ATP-binding subunit
MTPILRADKLTYAYPDGRAALADVSFAVAPGERVALVGPNGSGKSTLLLNLNGVLRTQAGTITVGGMVLADDTLRQIRARVGLTFQNPDDQLFSPLVQQDVAFGPLHMGLARDEVAARTAQALADVGMSAYADRVSYHLSIGEKKRVALAAVLSMAPEILLLDEPSAGLDPRARRQLIELLATFSARAMLISTHDMRLARDLCQRVIVLDGGRVVADGPADTILHNAALMARHGLETP